VPRWRDRQQAFAGALLASESGAARVLPPGVVGPRGPSCSKRFAVYRNNVAVGLIETLEGHYPAVRRLVGEQCFREMARRYAIEQPPDGPVMALYGASFADFIDGLEALAALPYLSDVARIERAYLEAYHAAEASCLDPRALADIASERCAELCFTPHPSLRLLCSRYPALTIWRMNIADGVPAPVELSLGEDVLLVRPEAEVQVRAVPPGGAAFLRTLLQGRPLAAAAQAASVAGHIAGAAPFDLAMHLQALLESRVFSDCWLGGRIDAARN